MNHTIGEVFHEAARNGTKAELDDFLASISQQIDAAGEQGANELAQEINRRDHRKYTPLHAALFSR